MRSIEHTGPLAGTRGIVLTQAWAGSLCTSLLGMMGADVIQVEVRKRPDSWRGDYGGPIPAALKDVGSAEHPWNCNPLYNSVNLNKSCITLDLQDPRGLAVFRRLLPFADFVAENFSPRVLGNLGIGYEEMRAIKPDVILCSLSAYGHVGPWANVPGIGGTIEPTSGQSALLGYQDGPPLNSGQMYPDAVAGLNGFAAILTALRHRQRTGRGQYIDLSMQDANLAFVGDAALEYTMTGRQRARMGNRHHDFAPHGVYPCAPSEAGGERWIAIACETEEQWHALCDIVGTGWDRDARFTSRPDRKVNEDALDGVIWEWTREQERDGLVSRLLAAGVVTAPVLDALEVAADPHFRARGVVREVEHVETGRHPQATHALRFSQTPAAGLRPAPLHGEHTREVLAELMGTGDEEYEELVRAGVSGMGPPDGWPGT